MNKNELETLWSKAAQTFEKVEGIKKMSLTERGDIFLDLCAPGFEDGLKFLNEKTSGKFVYNRLTGHIQIFDEHFCGIHDVRLVTNLPLLDLKTGQPFTETTMETQVVCIVDQRGDIDIVYGAERKDREGLPHYNRESTMFFRKHDEHIRSALSYLFQHARTVGFVSPVKFKPTVVHPTPK